MYIALQRTDYKYIVSFHNTDSPWCIARTRFLSFIQEGEGHDILGHTQGDGWQISLPLQGWVTSFPNPYFKFPSPSPPCYFLTSPLPRFLPFFPNMKPGPGLRCHTLCFRNARRYKTYDMKISYP